MLSHAACIHQPVLTFDEASMPEYVLREVLKQGFPKRKLYTFATDLVTESSSISLPCTFNSNPNSEPGLADGASWERHDR